MKLQKVAGATSEIWQVFIQDSSKTDGSGLTGLTSASAGLTAYYHRDTDTTATAISLVTMTVGTFTSGGFKEIDATNMPGWYQFCPPNAALASGAKSCGFHLKGATNMAPLPIEVQLTAINVDDATAGGISRLDAAVSSRMATYTQPTGFLAATFPSGTLASTNNITAASGVALSAAGLDLVLTESGIVASAALVNDASSQLTSINARQSLALIQAACVAVLAGAATTTVTIDGAAKTSVTRVTATVDSSGNRSAVNLQVPT